MVILPGQDNNLKKSFTITVVNKFTDRKTKKSRKRKVGDDLTIIVPHKGKTELLAEGVKDEVKSKLAE